MSKELNTDIFPNIFPMLLSMFPTKEPRKATMEDIEKIKTLFAIGNVPIDINKGEEVISAIKLLEEIGLLSLSNVAGELYIGNAYNGT